VIYALSALCLILAAALWRVVRLQRLTSARLSVCRALRTHDRAQRRDAERRAVEAHRQWCDAVAQAGAAERRLETVRRQMLTIAEATAADLAARPGPVRCTPAAPAVPAAPIVATDGDDFDRVLMQHRARWTTGGRA